MKLHRIARRFLTVACALPAACVLLTASASFAQDAAALPPGAHVTGGIGEQERMQMREVRGNYNLRLIFAQASTGQYLAGVRVSVDKAGSGLAFGPYEGAGPWLFLRLDPGTYRVSATYEGVTQTKTVRVGRSVSERVFYWPMR